MKKIHWIHFILCIIFPSLLFAQTISTVGGNGTPGYANGTASQSRFYYPVGVEFDKSGNIFVVDRVNNRIRLISNSGNVSNYAGTGTVGSLDGSKLSSTFNNPIEMCFDKFGSIYITDGGNNRIRKIDISGNVTTIAGSSVGYQDGVGTAARFNYPAGIDVDSKGNLFVVDRNNHRIRKITPNGTVSTFAGSGVIGNSNGQGIAASFNTPFGLCIDKFDNIYVADAFNHRIRKITPNGLVSTFAGSTEGSADGVGTAAQFDTCGNVCVDSLGVLFVSEGEHRIRKIMPDGTVTTIAGNGVAGFVDGDIATARFNNLAGIAVDAFGSLAIADHLNHSIRKYHQKDQYNVISGKIFLDDNSNCLPETVEKRNPSIIVKALPGNHYGISNNDGKYLIAVDTGTKSYTINQEFNDLQKIIFGNNCNTTIQVNTSSAGKNFENNDFADTAYQCALLNVSIQKTRTRRCFSSVTYVNYCNYGTADANNAQIRIEYPDYIVPLSSQPMWSSKSGNVLIYSIAQIKEGVCDRISIIDSVVCGDESIRGLTQCIKASISPANTCVPEDGNWDKSSIVVSGKCKNDSTVFEILNHGSGDMQNNQNYRVYINDTLVSTSTFKLNSGEKIEVKVLAQGRTIRLEADQHALHPGKSRPRETIEDCGNATSAPLFPELVTTTTLNDENETEAISCNVIRDSYDPNDKNVSPKGVGLNAQINPGTYLEYVVRFQNTGNDTAYLVRVVDTIDIDLDPSTFIEGSSSHDYTLKFSGTNQLVVTYIFNKINLPDSTTDQIGSNGLFSFRIKVPEGISLGTMISNKAYIYFDYNSPIITNETNQEVGISQVEDLSQSSKISVGNVIMGNVYKSNTSSYRLYPNPNTGSFNVELPLISDVFLLKISNLTGTCLKQMSIKGGGVSNFSIDELNAGAYIYEIFNSTEKISSGVLIKQ